MKRINTLIFVTLMLLLISCEKEAYVSLGFDCTINKNSNGLVIADIWNNIDEIYLNGFVSLAEGELELVLLNPDGEAVYEKIIIAPCDFVIDETFAAKSGYWKLNYMSKEGLGEIDLHLFKQ